MMDIKERILSRIISVGMMKNDDGTLFETFKPPCQVCVTMKKLLSQELGVRPFWEDDGESFNSKWKELNDEPKL